MTKLLKERDFYKTSDLALATVLSLYYPIEPIDRTNLDRVQFLFKREEGLEEVVEKYWRRELRVEPQAFFNQLRIIKARLYGER